MALSAVVITYQTGPVLEACLDALAASPAVHEIILVDHGNPAEVEAELSARATHDPKLILIRGQGNVGFAAGCNIGAARATSERLLFINPDAVLYPEAPAQLAALLDATPGLALIGGDLRCAEGKFERASQRKRLTLWRAFVSFTGLSRLGASVFQDLHQPLAADGRPAPVSAISGALFAMRRADYAAICGMDDGYFLHVEDIDLCRRVEDAGGVVLFAPGPHGVHQRSSSQAPAWVIARHKAASFGRYFRKFARNPLERFGAEIVAALLAVLLPMRARAKARA